MKHLCELCFLPVRPARRAAAILRRAFSMPILVRPPVRARLCYIRRHIAHYCDEFSLHLSSGNSIWRNINRLVLKRPCLAAFEAPRDNVWAWGKNYYGQLGDGGTTNRGTPLRVKKDGNTYLTDIVYIDAGFEHSMAIDAQGTIWVWGRNENGELGLNDKQDRWYATPMPMPK